MCDLETAKLSRSRRQLGCCATVEEKEDLRAITLSTKNPRNVTCFIIRELESPSRSNLSKLEGDTSDSIFGGRPI